MSSKAQEWISNMINNLSTLLPTDKAIVFTKIIGNHKNESANYVMELDNGYLISGGPTTINIYENSLIYKKKKQMNKENNSIYPVKNEKNDIDLIINAKKGIFVITIKQNDALEDFFRSINIEINSRFCINLNKNYLICNETGLYQYNDIIGKIIQISGNLITEQVFLGGIKIND